MWNINIFIPGNELVIRTVESINSACTLCIVPHIVTFSVLCIDVVFTISHTWHKVCHLQTVSTSNIYLFYIWCTNSHFSIVFTWCKDSFSLCLYISYILIVYRNCYKESLYNVIPAVILVWLSCSHFWQNGFLTTFGFATALPSPSGRVHIGSSPHIPISWVLKSKEILCFLMNGVPRMVSYLSRFIISRYVSTSIKANLIDKTVMKFTFDWLPEQPSCKVTGFASSFTASPATCVKLGVTASIVLPESNKVYAFVPFIFT